jgi:hypothetical protein
MPSIEANLLTLLFVSLGLTVALLVVWFFIVWNSQRVPPPGRIYLPHPKSAQFLKTRRSNKK